MQCAMLIIVRPHDISYLNLSVLGGRLCEIHTNLEKYSWYVFSAYNADTKSLSFFFALQSKIMDGNSTWIIGQCVIYINFCLLLIYPPFSPAVVQHWCDSLLPNSCEKRLTHPTASVIDSFIMLAKNSLG